MVIAVDRIAGTSNAGLLLIKLCAFGVMILDHVDWFLYGGALGIHQTIGRAVFPAFACVLGINLARMNLDGMIRLFLRLLGAGTLAQLPYAYLQGSWLPLNVLWTLAAAVLVVASVRAGSRLLGAVVLLGAGCIVDYLWFGVGAVVAVWWLASCGATRGKLLVAALIVVPINLSLWSLSVLVLGFASALVPPGDAPRLKWLFYVGYPLHLGALAVVRFGG